MPIKPTKKLKAAEPNLSRALLINLIAISITAIMVLGAVWIYSEYADFQTSAGLMKKKMVEEHKSMLKLEVDRTVSYLRYMMAQAEQRLQQSIKARVYEAHAIATHLYWTHRDRMSEDEIKLLVREALRPIRFNFGRGYYFATNMNGVEELFADRPELEGRDMLNLRGGQGEYVVKDMIARVREKKEGFYSYTWTKPNAEGNVHSKIAFVKYFQPFDWFIGTGEYLEDVVADIQQEVLSRIERIKLGQDGYVFAGTWQGDVLAGPQKGRNMLHIKDKNGVSIVKELIALAKAGGGFQTYVIPELEHRKSANKISYVTGIPEWQWYIGSGILLDDIEGAIGVERGRMQTHIKSHVLNIVITTLVLILLSVILFNQMAHKTRRQFDTFSAALARATTSNDPIAEQELQWAEFKRLARSANEMLAAREHARQSLIENEAKYRKLFEQTTDAVFVVEKKSGRYLDANEAALKLIGYSLNELREMTTRDTAPRDFRHHLKQLKNFKRALDFGELVYESPDGTERVIDLTAVPLDETSVYGIARDVTERKNVENAVRLNEKRYRELADALPQPVFETDDKGRLTFVNGIALEIFGYSREEFDQGLRAVDMIAPEDRDKAFENIFRVMNDNQNKPIEYNAQRKDGTTFPATIHSNRIVIDEHIVGIRGIIVDLSEQKALETRLHQAQKMEAIGNLAGGIAHDFNNILSAIIGYTELALAEPPVHGQPAEGFLKGVLKASKRAKSLVNQILTFARRIDEELKPVKVSIVAKEVLKLLRSSIPTTIKMESNITSKGLVMADLTQIHQIFMNLCTNAAQAMEDDGGIMKVTMVDIVVDENDTDPPANLKPGGYIQLSVQDTGKGIPAHNLSMIFEPYFTTKPIGEGTGLGLSVVHGIVETYGGRIVVDSEPGQGSVFTIYLPIIEQAEEFREDSAKSLPAGNERVLFVDDENSITDVFSRFLKRLGYHVTTKNCSMEALAFFKRQPRNFDLVVSDMTMPDMAGDKLASELVKVRSDIPIIICTGYSKKLIDKDLSSMNIQAVIMKPVTFEDLAQTIRNVLDEKSSPRQMAAG